MIKRPRLTLILAIVLLAAIAIGIPAVRRSVLRTAGWALVAEDPVRQADVIVISAAESDAGMLAAADLVRGGLAARVAIFADPPDDVDRELIRRGVPYEDPASIAMRRLTSLGIDGVERIPKSLAGTEEEARVLPGWCDQRQLRSVVVISTADHSRRMRRVFNRAVKGRDISITVRVTPYSTFKPDRWWQTRDGTRTGIVEFQKLLLDLALHPLS